MKQDPRCCSLRIPALKLTDRHVSRRRQHSDASETAESAATATSAAQPAATQRLSDGARILPAGTATVQLTEDVDHIILGSPGLWCAR